MKSQPGRCPVCRASFRNSAQCPRCGADLSVLMLLRARAYVLRQRALQSLLEGDVAGCGAQLQEARILCPDPSGAALGRLMVLLERLQNS